MQARSACGWVGGGRVCEPVHMVREITGSPGCMNESLGGGGGGGGTNHTVGFSPRFNEWNGLKGPSTDAAVRV